MRMTAPLVKITPSLRKMESDLEVNKSYEYVIESNEDRKALKENIMFLIDQKQKIEKRIKLEVNKKVS